MTEAQDQNTPAYFEVWLNRIVTIAGHDYKPGAKHIFDEATLAEVPADAIEHKRPK